MYKCIACGHTWGDDKWLDYSHGYCKDCIKERLSPIYKNKQLREGNFDCFGTAKGYCDRIDCKYRELCV